MTEILIVLGFLCFFQLVVLFLVQDLRKEQRTHIFMLQKRIEQLEKLLEIENNVPKSYERDLPNNKELLPF